MAVDWFRIISVLAMGDPSRSRRRRSGFPRAARRSFETEKLKQSNFRDCDGRSKMERIFVAARVDTAVQLH